MTNDPANDAARRRNASAPAMNGFESLMLAEHTHRIANDLSVMIAELEIRRCRLKDDAAAAIVADTLGRLRDVHGVQRCLLQPLEGDVDLAQAIADLASAIVRARGSTVDLVLNLTPIVVDARVSWRTATIVNELLTNAFKYGADAEHRGRVEVTTEIVAGRVICAVTDDGLGAGDWSAKGTGHGLGIIAAIADQLGGEVERSTSSLGTRIMVSFPRSPSAPAATLEQCGPCPH